MATQLILKYFLVKSIYEEKRNYIDVFVPFLLKVLWEKQKPLNWETIQTELEKYFNITIPIYTINVIGTRAAHLEYITQKQKFLCLEEKGKDYVQKILKKEKETNREINVLVDNIRSFIKEKHAFSLASDEIFKRLQSLLKKHVSPLAEFFNPQATSEFPTDQLKREEYYLIEYFKDVDKRNPEFYKILRNIYYGSLISTILSYQEIDKSTQKFRSLEVFFDTNFVFSIMGLHYSFISNPAKELFQMLKKYNFKLKIFDFTIDEMTRVLKRYSNQQYKYLPSIKVNSIYSNLKIKGWTEQDCIKFISNIENKIWDLGIEIEQTDIDLNKFNSPDDRYKSLSNYKPDQNLVGQAHDTAAIYMIKKIRKTPKRKIEDSSAIFLTSDLKLTHFDFVEMGHKDNTTCCEVISDRLFTNLLWLKNPNLNTDLPLNVLLSLHSELIVDRNVWDRFYKNLVGLKEEERISDADISTLIYYHNIEEDLVGTIPEQVTHDSVLAKIEEAKKQIDNKIKRKDKEVIELKKILSKKDKEKEEIFKKNEEVKKQLKEKANKQAKKEINMATFIILIILFGVGLVLLFLLKSWIFKIIGIISFIIGVLQFLGIKMNIKNWRKRLFGKRFNSLYKKYLYKKYLEELKLE